LPLFACAVMSFLVAIALVPSVAPAVPLAAWQRAAAGAGAYLAATLISSPTDVVKTRLQQDKTRQLSAMAMAKDMFVNEGPAVFFKGLLPALMCTPAAAVQYTLMDPLRGVMPLYCAAAIAGTLDITIKCPFDRIKTQLQSQPAHGRSRGALELLFETARVQGLAALWSGYGATLARDLPYLIVKWVVYATVQGLFGVQVGAGGWLSNAKNLFAGACAGAVAATVVTPADVVKTRLQLTEGKATIPAVSRELLAKEGPGAFFKGVAPRLARIPIYTAVTLATFDLIKAKFLLS